MNQLEGLLLLFGLSLGLLLAGYWLAAMFDAATPAARLALALLAGLGSLLLTVSMVNFFEPLAGGWALLCLAPIGVTLAWPGSRARLSRDLAAICRSPGAGWLLGLGALFFVLLLWPMLSDGQCVFYDGTSNHDSFFWISAAEHLKRHAYMVPPVHSATQPLTNTAAVLIGWNPTWGRMGAEGLLALSSSVSWTSPLKLYLYATAGLFLPWLAAVFLAVETFYTERVTFLAAAVMLAFQPVYVFFYSNANLPNLLGALTGAAAVIATEQILRTAPGPSRARRAWWGLLVLSLHGLACTYPEMIPFVLLPCGLLWLRPWFARGRAEAWRPCAWVAAGFFAGAALNPATTVRAAHGFVASFSSARANQSWANLFGSLNFAEYFPALGTLSVSASRHLGYVLGSIVTLALVASLGLAWWRARDRFGALAVFAGSIALAAYTLTTDFSYGWQKTVQFAGVFFAAALPVAVFTTQMLAARSAGNSRWLGRAGLGLTLGFLAFALLNDFHDIYKWSTRKVISQDWFQVRELSYGALRDAPVLVEAASFRMGFFYSMWATYFLPESRLYFGARGDENGGYLRNDIIREGSQPIPPPQAFLVSRAWADSFEADSPRLATGREYALIQKSNRVLAMRGVYPLLGVPEYSSTLLDLEIRPHSAANLTFELSPRDRAIWPAGTWQIDRRAGGAEDFSTMASGPPPWRIKIPLIAGQPNRVTVALTSGSNKTGEVFPFVIGDLRVEDQP